MHFVAPNPKLFFLYFTIIAVVVHAAPKQEAITIGMHGLTELAFVVWDGPDTVESGHQLTPIQNSFGFEHEAPAAGGSQ